MELKDNKDGTFTDKDGNIVDEMGLIIPARVIEEDEKDEKGLIKVAEVDDNKFDPEKQVYIILYIGNEDNTDIKSYDIAKGRTAAYEHVKSLVPDIDCIDSKVVADGVPFKDVLSVYSFMKVMEQYFSDDFDIEEYVDGDSDNDENRGLKVDI